MLSLNVYELLRQVYIAACTYISGETNESRTSVLMKPCTTLMYRKVYVPSGEKCVEGTLNIRDFMMSCVVRDRNYKGVAGFFRRERETSKKQSLRGGCC